MHGTKNIAIKAAKNTSRVFLTKQPVAKPLLQSIGLKLNNKRKAAEDFKAQAASSGLPAFCLPAKIFAEQATLCSHPILCYEGLPRLDWLR
jgi:hypothetical protein